VCVIIRRAVFDVVNAIKPGSSVMWGRDDDQFGAVWVIEHTNNHPWSRWWPDRKPNDSMCEWLAKFWQRPHLVPYLRTHFDNEVALPLREVEKLPDATSAPPRVTQQWVRGVQDAGAKAEGLADFDAVTARLKQSAGKLKPSRNGTHPKE
jgi:hypothetical protein